MYLFEKKTILHLTTVRVACTRYSIAVAFALFGYSIDVLMTDLLSRKHSERTTCSDRLYDMYV